MRRSFVALALAVTLPLPVLAGQVTVKEGETLSEIAERHGISLNRLMQVNGIRDADLVEAGSKLTIPSTGGGSVQTGRAAAGTVTVKEGETLSEIAERHGLSLTRLLQINGIRNADQVEAGQTLRLQEGKAAVRSTASAPAPSAPSYPRGASEHVVRSGESLSVIASGYGIGLSKLIAINGISDPDHVEAGTRLKLKGTPPAPSPRPAVTAAAASTNTAVARSTVRPQTATGSRPVTAQPQASAGPAITSTAVATTARNVQPQQQPQPATRPAAAVSSSPTSVAMARPDWRTYGPLQVNWAAWQPMGGSMVAPTLNRQGQTLYVAINCGARKVNSTTPSGEWQSWNDPSGETEQMVNDYCRNRS